MNLNLLSLFPSDDSQLMRHSPSKLEAADLLSLRLRVITVLLIQISHHNQNAKHEKKND